MVEKYSFVKREKYQYYDQYTVAKSSSRETLYRFVPPQTRPEQLAKRAANGQ